ncbi:hypothetical protein BN2537_17023 [Streptomyces venezuelae]|nr:hypothetical protein BN2537_17023 [Streptomyces venezuelae]
MVADMGWGGSSPGEGARRPATWRAARCRRTRERGSGKNLVGGDHLGDTVGRSAMRAACGFALLNCRVF